MRDFLRLRRRDLPGLALVGAMAAVAVALFGRARETPASMTPVASGTELVFVFIASSTCYGISDPDFDGAIRKIRQYLEAEAARSDQTFVSVGVSTDWKLESGIGMLDRFGPFDEISVGRGWLNTGTLAYMWEGLPGRAAVPQIVVLERQVQKDRSISISGTRLRYRKVSAGQIIEWSNLLIEPSHKIHASANDAAAP